MFHRRLSGALNVQFENSFGGFQTKFMTEVFANTESLEEATPSRCPQRTCQMAESNQLMNLILVIF